MVSFDNLSTVLKSGWRVTTSRCCWVQSSPGLFLLNFFIFCLFKKNPVLGERTYHWDPKVRSAYETVRLIFELEKSGSKTISWLKSISRLVEFFHSYWPFCVKLDCSKLKWPKDRKKYMCLNDLKSNNNCYNNGAFIQSPPGTLPIFT